ncbi:hypothetical protein KL950_002082 [Ogataea haglerorum]|nr:hypothetical protein KL950_002082 [Ogataea haglerorum]
MEKITKSKHKQNSRRSPGKKITRRRTVKSCQYCYYRKLRCDHGSPCQNCREFPDKCKYGFKETVTLRENSPVVMASDDTSIFQSRAFYPFLDPAINTPFLVKLNSTDNDTIHYGKNKNLKEVGHYDFFRPETDLSFSEIIDALPSRPESDHLVEVFWNTVDPMVPLLDRAQNLSQYKMFWDQISKDPESLDFNYAVILFAVYFSSVISLEAMSGEEQLSILYEDKHKYFSILEKIKSHLRYMVSPSMSCIVATVIVCQTGSINFKGTILHASVTLRAAETMGLHKDLLRYKAFDQMHHRERELQKRRLLWHSITYIETMSSVSTGLHSLSPFLESSVPFPSHNDYDFEKKTYTGPTNPYLMFAIARSVICPVLKRFMIYLNVIEEDRSEERLEDLRRYVKDIYDTFSDLIDRMNMCDPRLYSPEIIRWIAANIIIFGHRLYLLYKVCGMKTVPNSESVVYQSSAKSMTILDPEGRQDKQSVLKKLLATSVTLDSDIVEVAVLLLYETCIRITVTEEICKFKWFVKNSNPFQYLLIVIRDIYNRPDYRLTFDELPEYMRRFVPQEFLKGTEDARVSVCSSVIHLLAELEVYWPAVSREIFHLIRDMASVAFEGKFAREFTHFNVDRFPLPDLLFDPEGTIFDIHSIENFLAV